MMSPQNYSGEQEKMELSALEQYFTHFVHLCLVKQIIISDCHGNSILSILEDPVDDTNVEQADFSASQESNVTLSGARFFASLDQMEMGTPAFIHAQFHNAVVVQLMEGNCLLTVIGARSQGHCVGGILSVAEQIKKSSVYQLALKDIAACMGYD